MSPSQTKRFHKWLNLSPHETRHLASRVESLLVAGLEELGFSLPSGPRLLPGLDILGREIELERSAGDSVDTVTISFDKYRRPRFQVNVARRMTLAPHQVVHSCNLVAHSGQYFYFWGKPWWLPSILWTDWRADHLVDSIKFRLPQIDQFLSSGRRGPNISKPS